MMTPDDTGDGLDAQFLGIQSYFPVAGIVEACEPDVHRGKICLVTIDMFSWTLKEC